MVFRHEIDPSHGSPDHIEELRKIHEGISPDIKCVTTAPIDSVTQSILDSIKVDRDFSLKINC